MSPPSIPPSSKVMMGMKSSQRVSSFIPPSSKAIMWMKLSQHVSSFIPPSSLLALPHLPNRDPTTAPHALDVESWEPSCSAAVAEIEPLDKIEGGVLKGIDRL